MRNYLPRVTMFIALIVTYLIAVSCSENDEPIEIELLAPVLENYNVSVSEDISDTISILTFSATDADTELSELTYSIIKNSNDLFELTVDGNNVMISLVENGVLDFETLTSHEIQVQVSDGDNTAISTITIDVTDVADTASVTSAQFTNNVPRYGSIYDFSSVAEIDVVNYNEDYNYELKLTGVYFGEEYTVSLTKKVENVKSDSELNILAKNIIGIDPIIDNVSEEVYTTLIADVTEIDLEVDEYTVVLLEKESNQQISITGYEEGYTVIDKDGTNFISGTQLESDSWAKLSELNLNDHTYFRVRPTITNYINGIAVVLGVYDLDANKIGYIASSGSNGSGSGTYSYRFQPSRIDDLITENGEYLLRLEERTSTIDDNDTGYRNSLFQKINIIKIENEISKGDIAVELEESSEEVQPKQAVVDEEKALEVIEVENTVETQPKQIVSAQSK